VRVFDRRAARARLRDRDDVTSTRIIASGADVKQGDLFEALRGAVDDGPKPYVFKPNLEKIRAVVEKARASTTEPWDAHEFGYWRTVLPQMSRWLPEEERAELIREFEAELARLTAG
jgi:hypothetical protein